MLRSSRSSFATPRPLLPFDNLWSPARCQAAACLLLAEEAFFTVARRGLKGSQLILKVRKGCGEGVFECALGFEVEFVIKGITGKLRNGVQCSVEEVQLQQVFQALEALGFLEGMQHDAT